jgi:hypothetical protein
LVYLEQFKPLNATNLDENMNMYELDTNTCDNMNMLTFLVEKNIDIDASIFIFYYNKIKYEKFIKTLN